MSGGKEKLEVKLPLSWQHSEVNLGVGGAEEIAG